MPIEPRLLSKLGPPNGKLKRLFADVGACACAAGVLDVPVLDDVVVVLEFVVLDVVDEVAGGSTYFNIGQLFKSFKNNLPTI
jgi:hypothetical protein